MATTTEWTDDLVEFALREVIEVFQSDNPRSGYLTDELESVQTFEQVGMLSSDRGLVLTLKDGSEFQVTIVRSK